MQTLKNFVFMKSLKNICEGILSDIDISLDKMDQDIRFRALSVETKTFDELVDAFAKLFNTNKPKVSKTSALWKVYGGSIGKRFSGNKKVSFNFYSKSRHKNSPPYGAIQIVDTGKSCAIRWVSYDIKHDFKTGKYSKSERGLMWIDYHFEMPLIEFLTATYNMEYNSTSRQLRQIIAKMIKNPNEFRIEA